MMLALALMIAAGIGWGANETGKLPPEVLVLAVGVVALGGLLADTFVGLGVGLLGAAILAASQELLNRHATDARWAYGASLVLLVLLGAVVGTASERMRRERRRQQRAEAMAVIPAAGSLGLLGVEDAQLRLVEELSRAHRYGRPLSVVALQVRIDPQALAPDDARRARRAVARTLESGLHSTDTPFVIDDETFGVLLPEHDADDARRLADSLVADAGSASFADRTADRRRAVREVAELEVRVRDTVSAVGEAREQQAEALRLANLETLRSVATGDDAQRSVERA